MAFKRSIKKQAVKNRIYKMNAERPRDLRYSLKGIKSVKQIRQIERDMQVEKSLNRGGIEYGSGIRSNGASEKDLKEVRGLVKGIKSKKPNSIANRVKGFLKRNAGRIKGLYERFMRGISFTPQVESLDTGLQSPEIESDAQNILKLFVDPRGYREDIIGFNIDNMDKELYKNTYGEYPDLSNFEKIIKRAEQFIKNIADSPDILEDLEKDAPELMFDEFEDF